MKDNLKFLLCLKGENFLRFDRNESQEEINIASETAEVHTLSEEMIP